MSTITAILEPHEDGSLHLPLPVEMRRGKVKVIATLIPVTQGDTEQEARTFFRKAPLSASPISVNKVIQEVLALAGGELRRHGVEPSAELDFNLPLVMADFVQLEQVLLNLVMNAIESMATITDRPRVLRIQSRAQDFAERSAVLVKVCDCGVGLTTEALAGVFEAFYTTKPEGMGMGLWICRSIIEAHGGQVTAQQNEAAGATFQLGFLSAEQFLSSRQVPQTSCLILDVRMPGIGGFELGRRLAAEGHRIPIIFMTAHGGDDASSQAFQAGAVAFLIKPFSQESLVQALSAALAEPP